MREARVLDLHERCRQRVCETLMGRMKKEGFLLGEGEKGCHLHSFLGVGR